MTEPPVASPVRQTLVDPYIKAGVHEVAPGVHLDVIEQRFYKKHSHIRGSLPHGEKIETGFEGGPIFAVHCADSFVDVRAGLTLLGRQVLREPTMSERVIANRYRMPAEEEFAAATQLNAGRLVLPLSSMKTKNYCRWWLDSVAKLYVCKESLFLRSPGQSTNFDILVPKLKRKFQQETVALLSAQYRFSAKKRPRLVQGRSINSTGVVYGGGQAVGAVVSKFVAFLDAAIPALPSATPSSRRLYVSRNETDMRRILNEEEFLSDIRSMGFDIVRPGELSLAAQISCFRNADVILAPHGAALTNIIFCKPNTTLIEIFPRGGVHGSMFMRIASHLGLPYYFVVGDQVQNQQSQANPNNADIVLDKDAFLSFVRSVVDA